MAAGAQGNTEQDRALIQSPEGGGQAGGTPSVPGLTSKELLLTGYHPTPFSNSGMHLQGPWALKN